MKTYRQVVDVAVLVGLTSIAVRNHGHVGIYALPTDTHEHPKERDQPLELVALHGAFTSNSASATAMSSSLSGFTIKY